MFRRKFRVFEWKKRALCKSVKNNLEIYRKDKKNYNRLRNYLCHFINISQYVYSNMYPEVYCTTERKSFDLKSTFQIVFKTYKDIKKIEQTGKNPQKLSGQATKSFEHEQKPIEIDIFNVR